MKKVLILAGIALFATPVLAQTAGPDTPPPADQAPTPPAPPAAGDPMQTPPSGGVANTELSNAPTPSAGPRAQQGNSPANSAADANMSPAATAPDTTPVEQPLAKYPICKANQFDNCMEPGNGGGKAKKKAQRAR